MAERRGEWFQGLPGLLGSGGGEFWSSFRSSAGQSGVPGGVVWARSGVGSVGADRPAGVAGLFDICFCSVCRPPCSAGVCGGLLSSVQPAPHRRFVSRLRLSSGGVLGVLRRLDVSKVAGPDGVPAGLLGNCAPCVSGSLCAVFGGCLHLGGFPAAWGVASVVPVPEGGLPGGVSGCRPISLLPVVSGVVERCVCGRLVGRVSGRLCGLRRGFLRGRSAASRLLGVLGGVGGMLGGRMRVGAVCLDFARAFGGVDRRLLLGGLHLFGVGGSLFCWFSGCLGDGFRQVTVLGGASGLLPVVSGVPRGSILGPLVFLIYVNGLAAVPVDGSVALFADGAECCRPVVGVGDGRLFRKTLIESLCGAKIGGWISISLNALWCL